MGKNYLEVEEYRMFTSKAELHKTINTLIGIIEGVKIDGSVNSDELEEVTNWCNLHRHFESKSPFNEIIPLIDQALEDGYLSEEEVQDILWLAKRIVNEDSFEEYYDMITASIQQLEGILHGMLADNSLLDSEIYQLREWIQEYDFLKGTYPFDEIDSLLVSVLKDGIISDEERNILTAFFSNFVDYNISYNVNKIEMEELRNKYSVEGICSVNPEIVFEGKTFCFTGTSAKATRNEIAEIVQSHGAKFNNNIIKSTDYLIVGADGNPSWAYSCYGRKVEKAIQLRKNGQKILIIHENDFWDETY